MRFLTLSAIALFSMVITTFAMAAGPEASGKTIRVFSVDSGDYIVTEKVTKSEAEWREQLSDEEYHVAREHGTERAYSGKYWNHKEHGTYTCIGCGQDLFSSDTKYDSGTGWPSFYQPVARENVGTTTDTSFFMIRTEVHCSRCMSHLGHVFSDGPDPTGDRYCINSASLGFKKKEKGS